MLRVAAPGKLPLLIVLNGANICQEGITAARASGWVEGSDNRKTGGFIVDLE